MENINQNPTSVPADTAIEPFLVPLEGQAESIRALLEPMLMRQGFELVQLHLVRGQHKDQLRLFLDRLDMSVGGISMAELESNNRLISDLLDVEDNARPGGMFKKPYDLEVGSPGVERPLTKKSHFKAARGARMKAKTRNPVQVGNVAARSLSGTIVDALTDSFTLAPDGGGDVVSVSYDDLTSAHLVYEPPQKGDGRAPKSRAQHRNHKDRDL